MSRSVNDPRVARVMAAMDRAVAGPHTEDVLSCVASVIVSCGNTCDDFFDWSREGMRALVMAYALHAPEDMLDVMAEHADEQLAWCDWWDAKGYDESQRLPGEAVQP